MPRFTEKQGQYLSFIYYYTKLNRHPPSESDLQRYFRTSPPSIHQMVETLTQKGLISRVPGESRTMLVLVPREDLPELNE